MYAHQLTIRVSEEEISADVESVNGALYPRNVVVIRRVPSPQESGTAVAAAAPYANSNILPRKPPSVGSTLPRQAVWWPDPVRSKSKAPLSYPAFSLFLSLELRAPGAPAYLRIDAASLSSSSLLST
uniref:Uncharacterized protein n=1 Tax=Panagrellus redivivus TaxID=6233 RepID=A0A7E4UTH3_PANRE